MHAQRNRAAARYGQPQALQPQTVDNIPMVKDSPSTAPSSEPASVVGALVFGGAHGALAIVRSLGRRNIPVWLLTHDHLIAKFSRYTRRSISWPGPEHAGAVDWLIQLAERHRLQGWVLFPGGDAEAQLISKNHARLASVFRLTNPPLNVARWAYDKHLTNERAAALGLALPWSNYPRDRQDVAKLECRFPLILKPTSRIDVNTFTLAKAWRVDDREALIARYDQATALVGAEDVMLQELIPGDGSRQFSYAGLWDKGAPVASLTARRTRQYPIDFVY
jgi:predicted ATP-grasp superfamily ATP-dependent carboligase